MTGLAELVRSAIENVVRNATRHTRPGTSVEVGLRVDPPATAHLSVRDYGPGIDETLAVEMFKPFWRNLGGHEGRPDGAGLGLAITDRVIRMHEGRVRATNVSGGGLVVTIDLPLSPTQSLSRPRVSGFEPAASGKL
jgi:two-component system sensor histidine kinase CpxA